MSKPSTKPALTVEDAAKRILRTLAALPDDDARARAIKVVELCRQPGAGPS